MAVNLIDRLSNVVSKLGTARDKMSHFTWDAPVIDSAELVNAYRGDWLSRKVVDIPAADMTREWRTWSGDKSAVVALQEEERRLGVQVKTRRAKAMARLLGGAAILMVTDEEDASAPLDVDRLAKGGLRFLHVVTSLDLHYQGQVNRDVFSEYFGQPEYYSLSSTHQNRIHPSRVVRFVGNEVPDALRHNIVWGDSVLIAVRDALLQAASSLANTATLLNETKFDVINVPGLTEGLATKEYEEKIVARFELANQLKSIINTVLLDEKEEWRRVETSFQGLDPLLGRFLTVAAGAADIPVTRLLGQSPSGMDATGESDTRNYYDRLSSEQETELRPSLERLDRALQRSALGAEPDGLSYEWSSLWQLSDEERAARDKSDAEVFKIDNDSGVFDAETMRLARTAAIVENNVYPGFGDIDQAPMAEDDVGVRASFARLTADSAPRSLYVRRQVLNGRDIVAWALEQGFETTLDPADMHVTIMFSTEPVRWELMGEAWSGDERGEFRVPPGGPRMVEQFDGGAVVLQFVCDELSWRHEHMRKRGAVPKFPEYLPHVTLTYAAGDVDVSQVEPYRGPIVLGPEIFEAVDEDWKNQIEETPVA